MVQITKEWIETFCTDRGGYTMDQVRCLGFEKGFREKNWKKKAVGQWITEDAKLRFQELSSRKLAKGERKKIKQERIKAAKEADKLIAAAREQIRTEKEEAMRQLREEVSLLSLSLAEKILRDTLNSKDKQMQMIDRLLDEIEISKS